MRRGVVGWCSVAGAAEREGVHEERWGFIDADGCRGLAATARVHGEAERATAQTPTARVHGEAERATAQTWAGRGRRAGAGWWATVSAEPIPGPPESHREGPEHTPGTPGRTPAGNPAGLTGRPRGSAKAAPASEHTSFDVQRTPTELLADPEPQIRHLARYMMEAFDGARPLDHLARWLTERAFRDLQYRVVMARRTRAVREQPAKRIRYLLGPVHRFDPRSGVVEACIVVHAPIRCRVIALRLEGLDRRWRVTVLAVM